MRTLSPIPLLIAGAICFACGSVVALWTPPPALSSALPCNQAETTTDCALLAHITPQPEAPVTGTSTLASALLGLSFEYPAAWGEATETILKADPDSSKGLPVDRYLLQFLGTNALAVPQPMIDAYNETVAKYSYEGPGGLVEYYGQPLMDICSTQSFINTEYSNVRVLACENHQSTAGVPYVWIDVSGDLPNYGAAPFPHFAFARVVHAQNNGSMEERGVLVQTKSAVWPGMTIIDGRYSWDQGQGPAVDLSPMINAIAESLRY